MDAKRIPLFLAFFILTCVTDPGESIGCYTCKHGGPFGDNSRCESGSRSADYQETCVMDGQNRRGTYCTKIVGTVSGNQGVLGKPVVIRGCSDTFRTECKTDITVDGRTVDGCISTCGGTYCNSAKGQGAPLTTLFSVAMVFLGVKLIHF